MKQRDDECDLDAERVSEKRKLIADFPSGMLLSVCMSRLLETPESELELPERKPAKR